MIRSRNGLRGHYNPPLLTRREFHSLAAAAGAGLFMSSFGVASAAESAAFIHPGILHSSADLDRMRVAVRRNRLPISAGFERLSENPFSQLGYAHNTFASEIGRNPSINSRSFDDDANAAYQCSLMAAITGDRRYAHLARSIVLGWSGSLERVSGADSVLMASLGPFKLVNAAEILRAIGELNYEDAVHCEAMLRRAILPTILDFASFANGNWDTAAIKMMLAIAVFCDDHTLFERALLYYLHGDGNGMLTHYIYENGQCQESGRDQQHTQLGLGHMGDACEIAWHQGLDLYGAKDNRLLRGFEYTAAYNLGGSVDFHPDIDRTGKYRHRAISPRGSFRPIYEQILAHYQGRRGLPAPAVARVVQRLRPEGAAKGADHTGFGTLLYAGEASDPHRKAWPVVPSAVHAEANHTAVDLSWLVPRKFGGCLVQRAEDSGPFQRITSHAANGKFCDVTIEPNKKYLYRVSSGIDEPFSQPIGIVTGLPPGWQDALLGKPLVPGLVQYDGKVLTINAPGTGLMNPVDEGRFVATAPDCAALTARFVPETASQFGMFGLAFRKDFEANAPCVALLIAPGIGNVERRGWHMRLAIRRQNGKVQTLTDIPLGNAAGNYGRLTSPVWFRMRQGHGKLDAQFSLDGATWQSAGAAPALKGGRLGITVSSGIPGIDNAVRFDSVTAESHGP